MYSCNAAMSVKMVAVTPEHLDYRFIRKSRLLFLNTGAKAFCATPLVYTTLNYAVNKPVFEVIENPVLHCPVITPARGHVAAAELHATFQSRIQSS